MAQPNNQPPPAPDIAAVLNRMAGFMRQTADVAKRIHDHLTKAQAAPAPVPVVTPAPQQQAAGSSQAPQQQQASPGNGLAAGLNGMQQVLRAFPVFGQALGTLTTGMQGAMRAFMAASARPAAGAALALAGPAPMAGGASGGLASAASSGAGSAAAGGGGMAALGAAGVALGGVAIAAQAVSTALQQVVSTSVSFVQALNPGLILQYNMAVRDFTATIGKALTPIVEAAAAFTKAFGAILSPIMDSLKPVVEKLAQAGLNLANTFGVVFSHLARAAQPLLEAFAKQVENLEVFHRVGGSLAGALANVLGVITSVVGGVVEVIAGPVKLVGEALGALRPVIEGIGAVFSGVAAGIGAAFRAVQTFLAPLFAGLRSTIGSMQTAMMQFAQSALGLAVRVAQWIPYFGGSIVDGILKSLSPPRKDITGTAAPSNATTGDIGGLLSSMTRAALLAGPGGSMKPIDPMEAWRQETLGLLREIAGKAKTIDIESSTRKALESVPAKTPTPSHSSDDELAAKLKRRMR